jgi:hypothetical protein
VKQRRRADERARLCGRQLFALMEWMDDETEFSRDKQASHMNRS